MSFCGHKGVLRGNNIASYLYPAAADAISGMGPEAELFGGLRDWQDMNGGHGVRPASRFQGTTHILMSWQ